MSRGDSLGRLDTCRTCGARVRRAWFSRGTTVGPTLLDLEPDPRPGREVPTDALAWPWHHIADTKGAWLTRVNGAHDDLPTYVAHPCGVVTRTRGEQQVTTPFGNAAPPGAGGPAMADLEGVPLLVVVNGIERGITTSSGVSDAARVQLVRLDNYERHDDAMLWGKVLVGQFNAGTVYRGRIVKGQAQPGKNPPWTWVDDPALDEVASKALDWLRSQQFGQASPDTGPAPGNVPAQTPPPAAPPAAPAAPVGAPAPPWA